MRAASSRSAGVKAHRISDDEALRATDDITQWAPATSGQGTAAIVEDASLSERELEEKSEAEHVEDPAALEILVMAGGGPRQTGKRPVGLTSVSSSVCAPVVGGVCMRVAWMFWGFRSWHGFCLVCGMYWGTWIHTLVQGPPRQYGFLLGVLGGGTWVLLRP